MRKVSRRDFFRITGATAAAGIAGTAWGGETDVQKDDAEMILIPAGPFLMGTPKEDAERLAEQHGYHVTWLSGEVPQRRIELPAFFIDKYPVTNRRYAAFCKATGHKTPGNWPNGQPPAAPLDHPVTFVNRGDAKAFAHWAGKRLPTEAEWEKAARGPDGQTFPWGNEFDPNACQWNADRSALGPGTAPVSSHPAGASPYGVADMIGNAAEWCADQPGPGAAYIKGGCWLTEQIINLRPAARNMSGFDNNYSSFYGFRCARNAE